MTLKPIGSIGGSRGQVRRMPPSPKGPDSFVLTYNFFEMQAPRESVPPYEVDTPMGNPGSATGEGHTKSKTGVISGPIIWTFVQKNLKKNNVIHPLNESNLRYTNMSQK